MQFEGNAQYAVVILDITIECMCTMPVLCILENNIFDKKIHISQVFDL